MLHLCTMRSSLLFFVLLAITITACRKEPVSWNADWVVPLAQGELDIGDFVKEDYLSADDNGLLYLSVQRSFNEFNLDSVLSVLDTVIHSQFQLDVPFSQFTVPAGFSLFDITEAEELELSPIQMRKLKIKSGKLNYSVKNYFTAPLEVSYQIPSVLISAVPYGLETAIAARSGSVAGSSSGTADLSGAEFDLRGPGLNAYNVIQSVFNVVVAPEAGDGVTVFAADSIVVDLEFEDVVIDYALGYFGKHTITETRTLPIDAFSSIGIDALQFEMATLAFDLKNYTGIDLSLKIDDIRAVRGSQQVSLSAQPLLPAIQLARGFDYGSGVVPTGFDAEINPLNSQILPFLSLLPEQIEMDYTLKVNPLGDISGGNDFFYLDKSIEANLDMQVPLCFAAKGLVLRDTLSVTKKPGVNVSGDVIIRATNAFPFQAILTGRIVSPAGQTLHTFATSGAISSGSFNAQNNETTPVFSEHLVHLGEAANFLLPENRIEIELRFDTWNYPEIVKLIADAYISLNIIGDLSAAIEVN